MFSNNSARTPEAPALASAIDARVPVEDAAVRGVISALAAVPAYAQSIGITNSVTPEAAPEATRSVQPPLGNAAIQLGDMSNA